MHCANVGFQSGTDCDTSLCAIQSLLIDKHVYIMCSAPEIGLIYSATPYKYHNDLVSPWEAD